MKTHFRQIRRDILDFHRLRAPEFRVACGTDAHWTKHTTSDPAKVTCKRCLKFIENQKRP